MEPAVIAEEPQHFADFHAGRLHNAIMHGWKDAEIREEARPLAGVRRSVGLGVAIEWLKFAMEAYIIRIVSDKYWGSG